MTTYKERQAYIEACEKRMEEDRIALKEAAKESADQAAKLSVELTKLCEELSRPWRELAAQIRAMN